jgi:hypothetical protein
LDQLEYTVIVVALESQDIHLFQVQSNSASKLVFEEKESNEIKLEELKHIQPTGIPIRSISFLQDLNSYNKAELILIFLDDGSLLFINYSDIYKFESDEKLTMMLIKPKNNLENSNQIYYKLVEYILEAILFLGSNHHLYVLFVADYGNKKIIEINGNFDGGAILGVDKFAGFSKGNILLFKVLKIERKNEIGKTFVKYKVVQLSSIEAHYDYITFFFVKGKQTNILLIIEIDLIENKSHQFRSNDVDFVLGHNSSLLFVKWLAKFERNFNRIRSNRKRYKKYLRHRSKTCSNQNRKLQVRI